MIKIKRLEGNEDLPLPKRANPGDAGLDLCAAVEPGEPLVVAPGGSEIVPTGFVWAVHFGFAAMVCPRSGLAAKHQITVGNAPGIVDSGYRGEVKVIIQNHGENAFFINRGDRIAQMLIVPVSMIDPVEVVELDDTERGDGGFGSSGK